MESWYVDMQMIDILAKVLYKPRHCAPFKEYFTELNH